MPKKLIRRFMPDHEAIRDNQSMKLFGKRLHDPNLWHLNRRSISGAAAVGLFSAFLPMPFQMVLAGAGAILFRVNLPLAVATVWLTNPVTMPPIFYFNYLVGEKLLGMQPMPMNVELTMEWISRELPHIWPHIWQPLLLGSVVMAIIMATVGFFTVRGLWRMHIVSHLRKRKHRRHASR